jgi:hypothetical protein
LQSAEGIWRGVQSSRADKAIKSLPDLGSFWACMFEHGSVGGEVCVADLAVEVDDDFEFVN